MAPHVVHAGSRAVVLEDLAAPCARSMDADYRAIGDEFDREQYPLLRDNIGDASAMNGAMNAAAGRATPASPPRCAAKCTGATTGRS